MAYQQSDLDALQSALSKGVLSLRMGDKTVQYRSIAELEQAISIVKREINGRKRRGFVARTSKGL